MGRDEQLKTLESMVEESVETIDVHQEAQELKNLFTHVRPSFHPSINAQPCFKDFTDSMQSARGRNVRLLHVAGHGNRRCGFFWLKSLAVSTEYEEVPIDRLSGILRTEAAANGGTIECVVLNACETEEMGKKLRSAGVSHVVCWRSEVQDMTAKRFALDFYASLNQQEQGQDYGRAFEQAVARMDSGGGAARIPQKHLAAGAVDYVCLLSESGDRFPDTGHIRQGQDFDSDSRQFGPPKDKEHWAALAGQQELLALGQLGFDTSPMQKGNGLDDAGFAKPQVMWQLWGVANYTHLWGRDGKAVHAAAAAHPTKRQHALACLEKAVNFRREDMKKHARTRRCKGECPESRNCRDCKMRDSHEFMLRLMCESGDAMKALQAGAA
jgi:hypothetical protein